MAITHTIRLDLQRPGTQPLLHAKQGDTDRKLAIRLYDGGTAFDAQATGYTRLICYRKPDGTGGVYDKMPDNSDATTVTDNLVTAKLHPQMFSCAGTVLCELRMMTAAGAQLGTWSWRIQVEPSVTSGITSEDYYKFASLDGLRASLVKLQADFAAQTGLRMCSNLRATFGGQTVEGTDMPTVDGDVFEAVQLEVLGDDTPKDGDIIFGSNGYFAEYGLTDDAATLVGTGVRLAWPSGGGGGVTAQDVQYQGDVGGVQVTDVSDALDELTLLAEAAVPKTRTINGEPLTDDVTLKAQNIYAVNLLEEHDSIQGALNELADAVLSAPKHIIITLGDDGADGWTITEATAGGQAVTLTDASGSANYAALLAAINTSVSKGGTVELQLGSGYYAGAVSRTSGRVCITYLEMSSAPPDWSNADTLTFCQVNIEPRKVSVVWQEV